MTEPPEGDRQAAGAAEAGRVVLDLGVGVGALVLFAPAELDGAEIEISAAREPAARRTHALVRKRAGVSMGERAVAGPGAGAPAAPCPGTGRQQVSYAAVYPGLAAGGYIVWRDADTEAGTVTITGGQVTSWAWPWPGLGRPGPA